MFHFQNFVKPENEICEKRLPKCIIIGVPNSGTRELRDFLGLHPNIEIYNGAMQFFKNDDLYGKGDDWLKRQMPCTYSNQLTAIENEAYFHDLQVPERIYQFDKFIKLILVVKEPISRSISHFKFLQDGKFIPKAANYSDVVLDAKTNALNTQHPVLNMSIYDDNMRVWLRYFSLSQILIIESEKLNREPSSVLKRVEEFVGLEHYIRPNMFVYNKEQLFPCIRSNLTLTGMACHGDNDSRNETKPEDTASSEVIAKLKEFFKPRNAKFFKLIDKSFAW